MLILRSYLLPCFSLLPCFCCLRGADELLLLAQFDFRHYYLIIRCLSAIAADTRHFLPRFRYRACRCLRLLFAYYAAATLDVTISLSLMPIHFRH